MAGVVHPQARETAGVVHPQARETAGVMPGRCPPQILHLRGGLTNTGTAVTKAAQNPAAHRYVDARPRAFADPANGAP